MNSVECGLSALCHKKKLKAKTKKVYAPAGNDTGNALSSAYVLLLLVSGETRNGKQTNCKGGNLKVFTSLMCIGSLLPKVSL